MVVASAWLLACGDDSAPPGDAGKDAGFLDGGPRIDAGFEFPDTGPPPTGCDLLRDAGPPPPPADAGPPPALRPDGYPPLRGPGGPTVTFTADQLARACAYLDGDTIDEDHHNAAFIFDGYLFMAISHEHGRGGVAAWDFRDPCAPVRVGLGADDNIRETHATGVATIGGGKWLATTSLDGIQIWDVSDLSNLHVVSNLVLPGVVYPDSYRRVVMSVFWQAPFIYVGASDNGVFVVDASDPTAPELLTQYEPTPSMRVGGVHAIGNQLIIIASEGSRTNIVDISDPRTPRPIPGGTYTLTDGTFDRFGRPMLMTAYFGHVNGNRAYYARHVLGGGLIVYDIADPTAPRLLGSWQGPSMSNGGYVFVQHDVAFLGLSAFGFTVDIRDPTTPMPLQMIDMPGDVDTLTPIGNVIVVSVDDDAVPNQASEVQPWALEPDARAPVVNMVVPRDGATDLALSTRVGVTFDEFVELGTVWRGSFRVQVAGTDQPIAGEYSGQEGAVNFWPAEPLRPDTDYEVVIPAGGVADHNGNAVVTEFRSTFRTVSCP